MKQRSEAYYAVRSAVRWVVWSSVAALAVVGAGTAADWIDDSDENLCPVILRSDFSWESATGNTVNVNQCRPPLGKILLANGTWDWDSTDK
jgi:hypothetical protein